MPSTLHTIDAAGFRRDLDALRAKTIASLGPSDLQHMRKLERVGRALTLLGFATAWLAVNPLSICAIAMAITIRWMVMHHVGHGGYDKVPGVPARYTRARFAIGWRRWIDWFDWIEPSAWLYEHNHLHHYHTSELADPDLVDRNVALLRRMRIPRALKYVVVLVGAMMWKLAYYAPNALNGLEAKARHAKGAPHENFINLLNFWDLRIPLVRRVWARSVAPYALFHFVLVPSLFLPLGVGASITVLANRVLAEILANLHTFAVVVPSHAGEDLFAFDGSVRSKEDFYVRQVLCTANYRTGGDVNDVLHMWLNYQIEHHLFPDLPMTKYREIQPEVAALCAKHGMPYVQESVWKRLGKLLDVCVDRADVPRRVEPELAPAQLADVTP